ncbi:alpha/beta fold hydrolase [Microbispora sp. ATCC PTA-5024]|uniref:alpha/beta fold hydrolase n=1 Tax=Microbispora sp. ATCC PTA-5024 TaxID=316330 RepID=UPI0003DC0348|nr:alpha/beta hydrolase [Microbispora sp. ATCC PTA-5024]ETK34891.1 alpha/beta hydrolase [Microbispora sp. ATCC PTA-5024]
MTEYLEIEGGRLAYDVTGEGPLVVLSHGMGDGREAYRFLAATLVAAGYRVATADLRGHGESTTGWSSYTRTDTANDLLALIRHLGGPAVVVGHSFSGGSATIAAALDPDLVTAVVEIGPFTRAQKPDLGALLRDGRHRKGMMLLMATGALRSVRMWRRYLDHAYPGDKPADYDAYMADLGRALRRPGRMGVVGKMGMSAPTDAGAQLRNLRVPALVVMGTLDPDWSDPRAEAEGIVAEMPAGRGTIAMIDGAGHYPHAQYPDAVADAVLPFLKEHARG